MSPFNKKLDLKIEEGDLTSAVNISKKIFDAPYSIGVYQKRLEGRKQLVLTALAKEDVIGFKIGYDRFGDGSFYSWMGGVLPEYRRMNVGSKLADYQEKWAKEEGYKSLRLKTRKKHQKMIIFSEQRKFIIKKLDIKTPAQESRVWMEKII